MRSSTSRPATSICSTRRPVRRKRLNIEVTGDLPWARPQMKRVASMIRGASLSPTGVRAAFEARGDIFTVPAEKGDYRNLTRSTGAHERSPVWSPDGSQLAWLSDASGEYQLMIGEQTRRHEAARDRAARRRRTTPTPTWSPDGKQLLLEDNHLEPLGTRHRERARRRRSTPTRTAIRAATSTPPGRRTRAGSRTRRNSTATCARSSLYSLADGKPHQITDGMSDAVSPAFDAGGKYLYFLASTNYGPRTGWLEMSSVDRPARRSIYLAVLPRERAVAVPARDRRRADGAAADDRASVEAARRHDAAHGAHRSRRHRPAHARAAVPAGDYSDLTAGAAGTFFYTEAMPARRPARAAPPALLSSRSARPRRSSRAIRSYTLSADRKKLLYQAGAARPRAAGAIVADRQAGEGRRRPDQRRHSSRCCVDPRAEWAQIFRETWRIQREYFYDAKMHGANWQAVYDKYSALVPYVGHRADLGYLIATDGRRAHGRPLVSHGAGDEPERQPVSVGMLGADFTDRERALPDHADLQRRELESRAAGAAQRARHPGRRGRLPARGERPPARAADESSTASSRARRVTRRSIRVGKTPTARRLAARDRRAGASEDGLRTRAWIEDNRRMVDKLSGGRLAYVWLPNTAGAGYTVLHALLLRAAGQGGRDHRRALQPRRPWSPTTS